MEDSVLAFLERFVAALGTTVGFIARWGQALGTAVLDLVLANVVTLAVVVLFYVSYRLIRAGLGTPTPNYRQVGSKRPTMSPASRALRFSTPGYICFLAAVALLFAVGEATYVSALSSFLLLAAGIASAWYGFRVYSAAPADGALRSTEPKGLWLNRNIRAAAFAAVGLLVALVALGSLGTQVRQQAADFDQNRQLRLDTVNQELREIVEAIGKSTTGPAAEESRQALVPEL